MRAPQDIPHTRLKLTDEAQGYLDSGSPEAQVFAAVPPEGCPVAELKVHTERHEAAALHLTWVGG